jgi:hypothetical protein
LQVPRPRSSHNIRDPLYRRSTVTVIPV